MLSRSTLFVDKNTFLYFLGMDKPLNQEIRFYEANPLERKDGHGGGAELAHTVDHVN